MDLLSEEINAGNFMKASLDWLNHYPIDNAYAMYTTLGSHDTERVFSLLDRSIEKTRLAFLFLLTYPGAPAIYYGDEIGIEGGKDPECRHTFNWDESSWKIELRQWIKALIRVRKDRTSLRRGDYLPLTVSGGNVFAFSRTDGNDSLIVVGNASDQLSKVVIELVNSPLLEKHTLRNYLGTDRYNIDNGKVSIEVNRWCGLILGPD
jgi:cyclomaltodextrinase